MSPTSLPVDDPGRHPADITGFQAILLGLRQVHFDLNLWDVDQQLRMQLGEAFDSGKFLLNLRRLGAQNLHVLAIDANDNRMAGACQNLAGCALSDRSAHRAQGRGNHRPSPEQRPASGHSLPTGRRLIQCSVK